MRKTWFHPFFGLCSLGTLAAVAAFAGVNDKPVFFGIVGLHGSAR